jgi:hypothetical protein
MLTESRSHRRHGKRPVFSDGVVRSEGSFPVLKACDRPPGSSRSLLSMDDLDRRVIAMVGAHNLVTADHVRWHLGTNRAAALSRLKVLSAEGLVRGEQLASSVEPVFRATGAGLAAIGSRLTAPGLELGDVRHQLAAAAAWVASWDGRLGEPARVLSRRESEGLEQAAASTAAPRAGLGVEIRGRVQYPDVSVVLTGGRRIALYVLLWPYRAWSPDVLFAAYRDQPDAPAVLIFVDSDSVKAHLEESAERAGMQRRVSVVVTETGGRLITSA